MFSGPFAFALAAGMVATVNPCGFALLPAYLSTFVGLDDRSTRSGAVGRAVVVSGAMTLGFIAVFGLFGAVISPLFGSLGTKLPWLTIVIGVVLVGLGVYLLTGRDLAVAMPKLSRGGADGTLVSMFLFGVSYAIASLSCTIGPFLAATSSSFRQDNYVGGVLSFVAYGLGMGIVVAVLTVAVALAKQGVVQRFRRLLPMINRIAGVLLVVAGLYVAYYGWYEVRTFRGGDGRDPIVERAQRIQTWLAGLMPSTASAPAVAAGLGVVLAGGVVWGVRRRQVTREG